MALALAATQAARADDPPNIDFQPSDCTVAGKAVSLCATITDDSQVAKARIFFRPTGEEYYSFVEMAFGGISFCGTLPAPKPGKAKALDYYVEAMDDKYQSHRSSTYVLRMKPAGVCEFPPIETDDRRAASILVYATHRKQGKKLPGVFEETGVTFVAVGGK